MRNFIIILLAVTLFGGCTSVPSNLVPNTEPLSHEKAYVAGVFYYHSFNSPFLRMRSETKTTTDIYFISNSDNDISVCVVEPGVYTIRGILRMETWFKQVMAIPWEVRGPITVTPGTITYLGDFMIFTEVLLLGFRDKPLYEYNYDQFEQVLKQKYIVPDSIILQGL